MVTMQRQTIRQRIKSRMRGLVAMILAMMLVVGALPPIEARADGENAYYLTMSNGSNPSVSITPGTLEEGLGDMIDFARERIVSPLWNGDNLMLSATPSNFGISSVLVDDARAGGSNGFKYEKVSYYNNEWNQIGTEYKSGLKKGSGNGTDSDCSISIENGTRYFVDGDNNKFNTYLVQDSHLNCNTLRIRLSHIMTKSGDEVKKTGDGSGTLYTINTGNSEAKLYYSMIGSGFKFKIEVDGEDQLSNSPYPTTTIGEETYHNINSGNGALYTPIEITLGANMEYKVNYVMDHSARKYAIDIVGQERTSGDHNHRIEYREAKSPTYYEDGYEAHYECTICHKWFADINGNVPLDDSEVARLTRRRLFRSDDSSSSSDDDSSGGGSGGKTGSISSQSIDINGNAVGGPSANQQPDSGAPVSDQGGNWGSDDQSWTYTKSDGTLAKSEWMNLEYNGHTYWYYFDESAIMQTNWLAFNGATYYLVPDMDGWRGRMATGWQLIDNRWYYFEPTVGAYQGQMYRGAVTPDGHVVGADGAWDGNGTQPVSYTQTKMADLSIE